MAAASWEEIDTVRAEKRHELVLSGAEISKRIEQEGVDDRLYKLSGLNFLEISRTALTSVSPELRNLSNLTSLVLHGNRLETVPPDLGQLPKLKYLDLSRNQINSVPPELAQLSELQTLNISGNALESFPDVSKLVQLHIFDISHNQLTSLPAGVTSPDLALLAQIQAKGNAIEELPTDLSELPSMKVLDISDNKVTVIPPELSECPKLKDFLYGGNKLKDRRLAKMSGQCSTKAVLDYLHSILEKERKASGGKGKEKRKKKKGGAKGDDLDELTKNMMKVLRFDDGPGLTVKVTEDVSSVRPYIVCCVVRHLNLNRNKNTLKRFLTFQTKLHDTICKKRQYATIATHDLKAVQTPVTYDARPPAEMTLTPLGKLKETTADKLMERLLKEADDFRKEKRRNTLSGIHQFLDLLDGHAKYPCMIDGKGIIISFPPITNCNVTKVSHETEDILIEVTSSENLEACKSVMDEVLRGLLEMGMGCEESPTEGGAAVSGAEGGAAAGNEVAGFFMSDQVLILEQVKIVDQAGALKVVYPSRVDLQNSAYRVQRDG